MGDTLVFSQPAVVEAVPLGVFRRLFAKFLTFEVRSPVTTQKITSYNPDAFWQPAK